MLRSGHEQPSDGSRKVAFPGDSGILRVKSEDGAVVKEENDDGSHDGFPTFHPNAGGDEIGDEAIDDGAGADMDGFPAPDEPCSKAAPEPNEQEREFCLVFAIEKKNEKENEERRAISGEVRAIRMKKRAYENADESGCGAGLDSKIIEAALHESVEEENDENDSDERAGNLRGFGDSAENGLGAFQRGRFSGGDRSAQQFGALVNFHASAAHFIDGLLDVVRLKVHAPARILDEVSFETELHGIEGGEFDAVIGGQAADVNVGDVLGFEPFAEAGGFAVAIVEEPTVTVGGGVSSFSENLGNACAIERRGKCGAGSALDAVNRPKSLRQAVEVDLFEHFFTGMRRGETAVICGVPILGGNDKFELCLERIDDRDDFIPVRHRESAAGKKIILNVHKYEGFHKLGGEFSCMEERDDFTGPDAVGFFGWFVQLIIRNPEATPLSLQVR